MINGLWQTYVCTCRRKNNSQFSVLNQKDKKLRWLPMRKLLQLLSCSHKKSKCWADSHINSTYTSSIIDKIQPPCCFELLWLTCWNELEQNQRHPLHTDTLHALKLTKIFIYQSNKVYAVVYIWLNINNSF